MNSSIPDGVTRAEAVAAWRQNRARRKAARSPDGRIADQSAMAWADLGLHGRDTIENLKRGLRDLLERSPGAPEQDRLTVEEAILSAPGPDLPHAVRGLLSAMTPLRLVEALNNLVQAGMPWLSIQGERHAQLLAMDLPGMGAMKRLSDEFLDGGPGWRCYLAALGHPARVAADEIGQVVPRVPLTVVDDLIDLGLIGAEDQPWRLMGDPGEGVYVRARLAPETITRADAGQLQWSEMERRHAFLDGADLDGDDVYGMLAGLWRGEVDVRLRGQLPVEQQTLLDQMQHGAQVGRWPQELINDHALWGALAALWTPSEAIEAKLSEFHTWRGLYVCYLHILVGNFKKASAQIEKLLEAAATKDQHGGWLLDQCSFAEVHNMGAYLAQRNNELELAIKLLSDKDVVSDETAAQNLALIRKRRETLVNDREDWQNPYLALGLAHGDPDWKEQYRALLRIVRGNTEREAAINRAERRLRRATSETQFFVVPLSEDIFLPPSDGRSSALLPPVEPLLRRTPASMSADFLTLRERAAEELLAEFHVSPSTEKITDAEQ
ncbi:hypothetical protein [Nonomuraea jabiensis]|uniref:Uncharacterized protein n=1 Tax=Nonomuraea jabiensis TaxID=882448 RepID=A0A7W9FYB4_9ACTN|nr:hypothetical protein [Nonomuraea jabiensis]MBB5773736.1 hypothetical protein [Nonomuraea jabiensis]